MPGVRAANLAYMLLLLFLLFFLFRLQQPHVLMSNPCGAAQQATAPYYFAINKPCWGGGMPYLSIRTHRLRLGPPDGGNNLPPATAPPTAWRCGKGRSSSATPCWTPYIIRKSPFATRASALGKTYAYLVACLLWQSQRPRALWQPVVISTASVALQEASCKSTFRFVVRVITMWIFEQTNPGRTAQGQGALCVRSPSAGAAAADGAARRSVCSADRDSAAGAGLP